MKLVNFWVIAYFTTLLVVQLVLVAKFPDPSERFRRQMAVNAVFLISLIRDWDNVDRCGDEPANDEQ